MEENEELRRIKKKKIEEMMKKIKEDNMENKENYPNEPIILTDATFNESITKYPFIVVDCWAPWCGPCRMVGPVIEELAHTYAGKIIFGKLNVDENPQIPGKFNVMSIPTLLIFKGGKLVDTLIGALTKEMLSSHLDKYLN